MKPKLTEAIYDLTWAFMTLEAPWLPRYLRPLLGILKGDGRC